MAVFFDKPSLSTAAVLTQMTAAYQAAPSPDPGQAAAASLQAAQAQSDQSSLHPGRLVAAIVILAAIIGLAIWSNSKAWDTSTTALWGLATTVLGVIVTLLVGESSSA